MADETNITPAPAPAPAPEEVPAPQPPVTTSTGGLSDEDALKASLDPSVPAPPVPPEPEPEIEAAPGETTPTAKKAKFPFYRDRATNEVYPALRTPAGYEDYYPNIYEGLNDPTQAPKSE